LSQPECDLLQSQTTARRYLSTSRVSSFTAANYRAALLVDIQSVMDLYQDSGSRVCRIYTRILVAECDLLQPQTTARRYLSTSRVCRIYTRILVAESAFLQPQTTARRYLSPETCPPRRVRLAI
jgi:hypothetical protein